MATFLLDTNHLTHVVETGDLRSLIIARRSSGDVFGTCIPVLCELEIGIQQTRDPADYRLRLGRFISQFRLWPLNQETAAAYGEIWLDLRKRGRHLSQVDIMLAALAVQLDLVLLTTDRDFEALPKVRTENWCA